MPLISIPASQAVATRKANDLAHWGQRDRPNRLEPLAQPGFTLPFRLAENERIFTIGSCFARNVETLLAGSGFEIPMRDALLQQELLGLDPAALNNFSTASIYNELAWAVGEKPYTPADMIVEAQSGKFMDLNVIPKIKPDDFGKVVARRNAIRSAYSTFQSCGLVIMTLGLIEIWFDQKTGEYINGTPTPAILQRWPDRFSLHVLSYRETYDHLERAINLVLRYGRKDVRILLSVSPVGLGATHRDADVIVANCYSKSCQRAVAEEICSVYDAVTYFPSYESVTHSDRKAAYENDFTHATEAVISLNVKRLVSALTGHAETGVSDDVFSDPVAAAQHAVTLRETSDSKAAFFFAGHEHLSERSVAFATEHAEFLLQHKEFDKVAALGRIHGAGQSDRLDMACAKANLRLRRADHALQILNLMGESIRRSNGYWMLLMDVTGAMGDPDQVRLVMKNWIVALPKRAPRAHAMAARWFLSVGDPATAHALARQGRMLDPQDAFIQIQECLALLGLGEVTQAKSLAEVVAPSNANERLLLGRLFAKLG